MSHQDINRALHAMAAHLHRYTSELKSIDDTIALIIKTHGLIVKGAAKIPNEAFEGVESNLIQIASQVKAIKDFVVELEKKIQTSLALVSSPANKYQFTPLLMKLEAIQSHPIEQ